MVIWQIIYWHPTHLIDCRWDEDNGVCCHDPRIDGAICLKMFQYLPSGHSPGMTLSKAARYIP
ncbi:hypothetical protein PEX1_063840 [Penicillium expansum]|uniref:Uncharacterized protein n=1 Tax=Penicillium expansum TaxID=27334 RepID=A0A0A2I3U7_PENEN|nr:hypothetical protein PEX2_085160 [Penicillium expansum]KGO37133.1 hypothetical protein PEXP_001580 [Penicillium expansum]KGO52229.1 hypothetical protein PEX1_063840 [Penicillium expansum]KGO61441.1 hypothetical protein PEX2_085160 [Penicillium expansum]